MEDIRNNKNIYVAQGGILGQYAGNGTLDFTNCSWTTDSELKNTRETDNNRIGGFAGRVLGNSTVKVSNCTLGGKIEANSITKNAAVGGLIAESLDRNLNGTNFDYNQSNSTISISNLTVSGANISAKKVTETCGGLLGYSWNKTDVTFGTNASTDESGNEVAATGGVTISGCELNANNAKFGGLVYQATGYWNATAANSIHFTGTNTTIKGKSDKDNPSGLLVGTGLISSNNQNNALYLEVGTWGSATDAAYTIDSGAVTLTNILENFDELVGTTIKDNKGNDNAVVSLAVRGDDGKATAIDNTTCNTYKGQIENYKNGKTRYYYNLDSYRSKGDDGKSTLSADELDSSDDVLSWSVSQYAAINIRDYFCKAGNEAKITGDINLTGYSYYPVSPLAGVTVGVDGTTLTFAYEEMNGKETSNKTFDDSAHQHYLMHHGLLYDTVNSVTVNKTTFAGTVGKNSGGSGALIFGSVNGDPTKNPVEVKLTDVTLAGLCVADVVKGTTTYAPLLINKITQAAKLNVTDLSTGAGYTADSYAATSLIGRVGDANATKLTLTFSNIALDGRKEAESGETKVYNNGKVEVNYNTTHTIFTNATLLESFMYKSEGSGTYNFNSTDDKVTYGVELSNSGESGRNPDKQYQYYDAVVYVTDEQNKTDADEAYVKGRYTQDNFIRYVHFQQSVSESKYELDINQKTTGLLSGCGTYGDPYIITDPNQLVSLAQYINEAKRSDVKDFKVVFNSKVLSEKKQTSTSYHTSGGANDENTTGKDKVYTWNGTKWVDNDDAELQNFGSALSYLLNAYYKIEGEVTLPAEQYSGLGTLTNPFSGVIVGENNNTVSIKGDNENKTGFGSLIAFSRGSVVKDLTVDYTDATITMTNSAVPSSSNNPFFGGVVGYCMGGDTIIDNVSVNYGENSVTLSSESGQKPRLIAAGGYVGLVGGAKETRDTDKGYEKTGGGVVFRNMGNHTNNFAIYQTNAAAESTYFYCNPYVGRVLDGYACYDGGTAGQSTLNNTDKNYTIPDLVQDNDALKVEEKTDTSNNSKYYDVAVNNAQGLWLLSAIVNSGAGAMDGNGTYQDVENKVVDAYQVGKPRSRTADYSKIGISITDEEKTAALADEVRWGGVAGTNAQDTSRVSYLVSGFTSNDAAKLTGRSVTSGNNAKNSTNNPVALTFAGGKIDMSSYGNGFRGIGGSYGENKNIWKDKMDQKADAITQVYRRTLLVSSVTGTDAVTQISLAMDQHNYTEEYNYYKKNTRSCWLNQGAGLFVDFSYQDGCTVANLKISGNVKVSMYSSSDGSLGRIAKSNYDVGVGGFAARTAQASGLVTFTNFHLFDLTLYGGTGVGGVFGVTESTGGKKDIIIQNWTAINVSASNWIQKEGSVGGLVGWHHSHGTLTIGSDDESEKSYVKNMCITANEEENPGTGSGNNAGGLVSASDYSTITIKRVYAEGITVTATKVRDVGGLVGGYSNNNGDLSINNCNLNGVNVSGTNCVYVGGAVGRTAKNTKIDNVTITGESSVTGTYNKDQDFPLGGFVGRTDLNTNVDLSNCHITGLENNPVKISNKPGTGGFIGGSNGANTFKNCSETYVNILAAGHDASGLVGKMLNGSTNASNVEFSNVIVATSKNDKYVGLLTGDTNSKNFNGYNILVKDCTVGYNTSATIENPGTSSDLKSDNNKVGLWFGQSNGTSTLVAVAVKGTNQPQKDVGTDTGTTKITYADYPVDQKNQPESGTASPWLDVNPQGKLSVKKSDSASAQPLTGNGVGYMTGSDTTLENSIAHTILTEAKVKTPEEEAQNPFIRTYWNVKDASDASDTSTTFSKLLDEKNPVYLSTYQKVEQDKTKVPQDTDFPVVVVNTNNNTEVDTALWNFIAAMTNVASGTLAQQQVNGVAYDTYKWTDSSFEKQENASLTVTSDKTIKTNGRYDNEQSQITVLDVQYQDPTSSDADKVFHLYIPVLVRKVLDVKVNVDILEGTSYYAPDYTDLRAENNNDHYATARPGEPVTAYIEYNYNRSKGEWQNSLNNGEDLLWSYQKQISFDSNASELPEGTKLTLVDRQTGKVYTHPINSSDEQKPLNFGTVFDGFKEVPICDLLDIKEDQQLDTAKNAYIKLSEAKKTEATVKIGDEYYRPATVSELDNTENLVTLSVGEVVENSNNNNNNYLKQGDAYYLTIEVPETSPVINIQVGYGGTSFQKKEGSMAPPTSVIKKGSDRMVLYDGVKQKIDLSTNHFSKGKTTPDDKTVMSDGDSIQITVTSTLELKNDPVEGGTDTLAKLFKTYPPTNMYQEFEISLKKYDSSGSPTPVTIMADTASWTYTITAPNNSEFSTYKGSGSSDSVRNQDTLEIRCNDGKQGSNLPQWLKENNTLKIQAVITLSYEDSVGDKFPVQTEGDTNSGISVSAESRVANRESQLSVTTQKISMEDTNNRYHTEKTSYAKLDYTVRPSQNTADGDKNAQLGINPSDAGKGETFRVDTVGNYDCSGVQPADMEKAASIQYTLKLYQKTTDSSDNDNYLTAGECDFNQYWTDLTINNETETLAANKTTITKTVPISDKTQKTFALPVSFTVRTGKQFEEKNLTYANYKVLLEAVLLDNTGTEISGTAASDYVIYTNARIYPQMLD